MLLRHVTRAVPLLVAAALTGCAVEPADEAESTGESQDHLLAGRRLGTGEIAALVRGAGFPESVVGRMVCTAKYESSYYERASNRNRNGTTDYGLFQINSVHLREAGCPSSAAGLYDAAANARCAYHVYRQQGINAWYGYQKHRAECDRTRAAAAGGADEEAEPDDAGGGCWSGTLDEMTPALTCVESKYDGVWFQCMNGKWYRGVASGRGPYGRCASMHPL